MDEYRQVGPDKPGYAEDVDRVATLLFEGKSVILKFAANNTAKHVMLARLDGFSGEVLSRPEGFFYLGDGLFVGIEGQFTAPRGANTGGAAWLPWEWGTLLHPAYVGGYVGHPWGWNDTSDVSSEPFVRFLNDIAAVASVYFDGPHRDCDVDYRHNHSTAPLRQVLTESEARALDGNR